MRGRCATSCWCTSASTLACQVCHICCSCWLCAASFSSSSSVCSSCTWCSCCIVIRDRSKDRCCMPRTFKATSMSTTRKIMPPTTRIPNMLYCPHEVCLYLVGFHRRVCMFLHKKCYHPHLLIVKRQQC